MFKTWSTVHNAGWQMGSEIIPVLYLVCIKQVLQVLLVTQEFLGLKCHQSIAMILMKECVPDFCLHCKSILSYYENHLPC